MPNGGAPDANRITTSLLAFLRHAHACPVEDVLCRPLADRLVHLAVQKQRRLPPRSLFRALVHADLRPQLGRLAPLFVGFQPRQIAQHRLHLPHADVQRLRDLAFLPVFLKVKPNRFALEALRHPSHLRPSLLFRAHKKPSPFGNGRAHFLSVKESSVLLVFCLFSSEKRVFYCRKRQIQAKMEL